MDNERLFKSLLSPGNWIQKPKYFRIMMTASEADFLAYLIHHAGVLYAHNKIADPGDWFYCKMDWMEKDFFMPKRQQTAMVCKLKKRGFISDRYKGMPKRRRLRIEYGAIMKAFQEAFQRWEGVHGKNRVFRKRDDEYRSNGNGKIPE